MKFGTWGVAWSVAVDDRTCGCRVHETFDVQWNALFLQRLYGFRVNDGSTVKGEFYGFTKRQFFNQGGVLEGLRISIEHSRYILPDGEAIGAKAVGEYSSGIIRSFSAQGGRTPVGITTNKALHHIHLRFLDGGGDTFLGRVPLYGRTTELIVCFNQGSGIEPKGRHASVDKGLHDTGRNEFAVVHDAVVLFAVGAVGLLRLIGPNPHTIAPNLPVNLRVPVRTILR
jgi:hypothetical protein